MSQVNAQIWALLQENSFVDRARGSKRGVLESEIVRSIAIIIVACLHCSDR